MHQQRYVVPVAVASSWAQHAESSPAQLRHLVILRKCCGRCKSLWCQHIKQLGRSTRLSQAVYEGFASLQRQPKHSSSYSGLAHLCMHTRGLTRCRPHGSTGSVSRLQKHHAYAALRVHHGCAHREWVPGHSNEFSRQNSHAGRSKAAFRGCSGGARQP